MDSLIYKEIAFDSPEEVFVAMWLDELQHVGYVKEWKRATDPINITKGLKLPYIKITKLKTKTKTEKKFHTFLRPSEYTADFSVKWTIYGWIKFVNDPNNPYDKNKIFFTRLSDVAMLIEVKPSFDQYNMERLFVLNQKFIWDKYKVFVNLVEPIELFKKTFMPAEAAPYFRYKIVPKKAQATGKKKGDWKMDWIPKTLKQFL